MTTPPRREQVLDLIREERVRQVQQYGTNEDLLMGFGSTVPSYPWLSPFSQAGADEVQRRFRHEYEQHVHVRGKPTWMHLIREEVAELFETTTREDAIAEAVQVAALCTSLVELLLGNERTVTLTDEEWKGVEKALCVGGLRQHLDSILLARTAPDVVELSDENRRILLKAYDDGNGGGLTIVPSDDPPWFAGMYEGDEICEGLEHEGTLYTIVHLSGGGLVSVIVGRGLIDNEMGPAFHSINEAKAYVQGRIEK